MCTLSVKRFEEMQLMNLAWCQNIADLAAWNSGLVEEVDIRSVARNAHKQ